VDEALALLSRYGEDAKILAGGQSLIALMKRRIAGPRYLIDVSGIQSLTGFEVVDERIVFGALCRHAEVAESTLIDQRLPIMTDAAKQTADIQVRNRGTLGGSLAHADPTGGRPAALLSVGAELTLTGADAVRTVSLEDFILDAYTTRLGAQEMVTAVSVPFPEPPCGGAYLKSEKRAGDFAVASVGVQLKLDGRGNCRSIAVSLGALGAFPTRVRPAEQVLQGMAPSPPLLWRPTGNESRRGPESSCASTMKSVSGDTLLQSSRPTSPLSGRTLPQS
jgi:carbon-monoxide dehydrogenase medium subunit